METAIYVRVSTEEQAQEGFSIRAQEQKLKDYTRIKDWSIYNIYADEGISGKNITARPAVNKMIEDIKNGFVKNVVVFKIDRLTRSTGDLVYLIDLFNEHNCAFNSLMESIDTQTASGRMFLKIIGIFAEFERENIAERVKLGCERKVREGYSLCSYTPSYGYDREKGQKIQTINQEEAIIVREMFDMYVNQNISLTGIAKRLNIRKVPTKNNCAWVDKTILGILTNCTHIGKVRYAVTDEKRNFEVEGLHEPIISEELFNEAQRLIEKNKRTARTKRPRDENYFIGFLFCNKCGSKLVAHSKYQKNSDGTTKYISYYRCYRANLRACDFGTARYNKMEIAFQEYIKKISNFDETDVKEIEDRQKIIQEKEKLIQEYNEKLRQLETKEKEILNQYVDDKITLESYRAIKERIDKDKDIINSELKKLTEVEETMSEYRKKDIVLELKRNWEYLTNIEKRQFLMKFVKKIVVSTEKEENGIYWNVTVEDVEFV